MRPAIGPELLDGALERVVGANPPPMFARKEAEFPLRRLLFPGNRSEPYRPRPFA
jgi:hypothetical protein